MMMTRLTLAQVSEVLNLTTLQSHTVDYTAVISRIITDTRILQAGDIFLALDGDRFDGHDFIDLAIEKGAIGIIFSQTKKLVFNQNICGFPVADTLLAYQSMANWWRNQFSIPVIGITGSVGKTTTKELIAAVLSVQGQVLKTQANYNNEIGVPKTILELNDHHDFAVIEMGMRGKGEIAVLCRVANPNIAVITNVGTAHIGRLGSEQAIADAKCELLAEMSADGVAILNYDNPRLMATYPLFWQGKTITYGLTGGDIHGELIDNNTLLVDGYKLPLPLAGKHNAVNYLSALAVAKVLGISWDNFTAGLTVNLPDGRAKSYQLNEDIILLDETYNAGLESMLSALQLLAETVGNRHIAVLGTMKELGERSPDFHYQVGEKIKELNLDQVLILVDDPETVEIARGAEGINCECFTSHTEIVNRLKGMIKRGDRILFKASHSVGLDQVINQFVN
jgi:UDP-N-acetylmuramoyl-tripeptide--D-alanyl-D-alanine ligase